MLDTKQLTKGRSLTATPWLAETFKILGVNPFDIEIKNYEDGIIEVLVDAHHKKGPAAIMYVPRYDFSKYFTLTEVI